MIIRLLKKGELPPFDLLLLADPSKEMISDYIKDGVIHIAESESGIVGVVVLLPQTRETAEVMNLAVKEDSQGNGYGKKLLMHALKEAKSLGFKKVEIGTGNSSIHQLALYQKAGFRITGIDADFFIRNYDEPIFENGIQCMDKIRMSIEL